MTTLDVPYVGQPADKPWCLSACAAMLARHHGLGKRHTTDRIAEATQNTQGTESFMSVGMWFMERGFSATVMAHFPHKFGFPGRFAELRDRHEIDAALRAWSRKRSVLTAKRQSDHDWQYMQRIAKQIPLFLDAGGIFLPRPVFLRHIKSALRKGEPPIMNVDVSLMWGLSKPDMHAHAIVPVGVERHTMIYHDPAMGNCRDMPLEVVMHGCHRNDSEALFISPP